MTNNKLPCLQEWDEKAVEAKKDYEVAMKEYVESGK